MSTIDLRDAFHTLRLAKTSQKYCGITRKQNFDVIMDDTFIHSTKEEHMDDPMDLFKVLQKYGLTISPHKCQFFKKKIVYTGLEFQVENNKVCHTPLKDKCKAIRNLESQKTLKQTRAFI